MSGDKLVRLTSGENDMEISLIINLLKNNGINAIARERKGSGDVKAYLGRSAYGADIYVWEQDLEEAKDVISIMNKQE